LSHVMGKSRSPRLFILPKATPSAAELASSARAAGVEDQVTFAGISWEPEKPHRMLRLVTGADVCRGRTEGSVRCAVGWRIGA
jgi:hypothetical protein